MPLVLELAASVTFVIHLASQLYLLSCSSTRESEKGSFSPNNYFIALYFSFNAALTIVWLYNLSSNEDAFNDASRLSNKGRQEWTDVAIAEEIELDEVEAMLVSGLLRPLTRSTYLLFYIFSNVLLGNTLLIRIRLSLNEIPASSSLTASQGFHDFAHLLLIFNFAVNLFSIRVLTEDPLNSTITPANFLTHLVMKTNTGLCTLLIWKTWSNLDVRFY